MIIGASRGFCMSKTSTPNKPKNQAVSQPTELGEIIEQKILRECRLSVSEFARRIFVHPSLVFAVINGRQSINIDLALRFSRYFGNCFSNWHATASSQEVTEKQQMIQDVLAKITPHDKQVKKKPAPYPSNFVKTTKLGRIKVKPRCRCFCHAD